MALKDNFCSSLNENNLSKSLEEEKEKRKTEEPDQPNAIEIPLIFHSYHNGLNIFSIHRSQRKAPAKMQCLPLRCQCYMIHEDIKV